MELAVTIISFAASLVIGVFGFFLKRTFTRLDDCASKEDVKEIHDDINDLTVQIKDCVKDTEFKDCQARTRDMSNRYASKEEVNEIKNRMDKLEKGIDYLKENAVRKDDFVRTTTGISDKIDELTRYIRDRG